ncbi:MAG: hypothetical protein DWQ07_22055 [Chloroflexi bacterium]|nr:MAG: hypothetical protein DWQ07_22055 [Chloroflexota bacterium]MBL1196361.1 hypothetical protein [Chloroflexota bacterium]NOH13656.1 hypothetical protein [Chloroflexota bacterium]
MFRRRGIFSLISFLLVIALIGLGGYMLYNSGFNQGLLTGQAAIESGEAVPVQPGYAPYGRYYGPGFGLFGLGLFGLFFKFLFWFFFIGFIFRMLFRPWGWGWHGGYGRRGWRGKRGWGKPPWAYDDEDSDDEDGEGNDLGKDAEPATL